MKTTNATEEIMDAAEPGLGETGKGIAEVEGGQVNPNGPIGETMGDRGNIEFQGGRREGKGSEAKLTAKPGVTVPSRGVSGEC